MKKLVKLEKNDDEIVFIDNGLLNYFGYFTKDGSRINGCVLSLKDIVKNTVGTDTTEMKKIMGAENFELYFQELLKMVSTQNIYTI